MNNKPVQISFFPIKDNPSKLDLICLKAREAFDQKKKLLILVGTQEAGQYIDALLWRKPEESFIPHVFTQGPTEEWIAITMNQSNINHAQRVLNLQMNAISFFQEFEEIIELYDETSPEKLKSSQDRLNQYQSQGLLITNKNQFIKK